MKKLKCCKCGNNKKFYRDISVTAKLRVNAKGEDLKTVFSINKRIIDGYYNPIYCCECGEQVSE